ncbi:gamma subclass chorismate mutase AroQ [Micromonospora sp. NPDC050397]|uniref:gamma subclass chorismate mutase AroQ n=1 Tax=Micromonospora sp. NPDC050397 TaxID=3364279 RepID=UPI00384E9F13
MISLFLLGGSTVAAGVPKVVEFARRATATPATSGFCGSRHPVLADLAVRRLLLADQVAAAKFLTGQPVDDPVREREILDEVVAAARDIGLDPTVGMRFFRDQIEANKVVQRGLHARWRAQPSYGPHEQPDLARDVRPELDRITASMLRELLATTTGGGPDGVDRPTGSGPEALRHLDALHRGALAVALRSVPLPTTGRHG